MEPCCTNKGEFIVTTRDRPELALGQEEKWRRGLRRTLLRRGDDYGKALHCGPQIYIDDH